MDRIPEGCEVVISYDKTLQLITEKEKEDCYISLNMPFFFLLSSVLESYPEIKERFPPGVLGFTVNGRAPDPDTVLKKGDKIHFQVPHLGDHLIEGQ